VSQIHLHSCGVLFQVAKSARDAIGANVGLLDGEQRDALVALVFSASAIEAYCNEIGSLMQNSMAPNNLTSTLTHTLDILEDSHAKPLSKLEAIWRAVTACQPNNGTAEWENLNLLFNARNYVMHKKIDRARAYSQDGAWNLELEENKLTRQLKKWIVPAREPNKTPLVVRMQTKAFAQWSCATVEALLISMYNAAADQNEYDDSKLALWGGMLWFELKDRVRLPQCLQK
jgi:hypothetical protein